jgi:CubicO group peptidase (beta-lactamase class C family)
MDFCGNVLMARDGKILFNKGYGLANREWEAPNAPKTKFRLGSITKQFTAMAIMQLQEKGLLDVKDPFSKYAPDFPNGDRFTLHHLLKHTSGVFSLTSLPDYSTFMVLPLTMEEIFEKFQDRPLEFEPGSHFKYSNSGYIMLGHVIEVVTEGDYADYLRDNIFAPLSMEDTGYDEFTRVIQHRASGYAYDRDENTYTKAPYIDMHIPHGAGALYSTVEDLYKWDRALYTEKLISAESLDTIFTPGLNGYGYGWRIVESNGRKIHAHNGGINGFVSHISRYPEEKEVLIILSNLVTSKMQDIRRDLSAILSGRPYEMPEVKVVIK